MAAPLECPVDFVSINENKVRLTALSVFILGLVYLSFPESFVAAFLVLDFFLRAFNLGKYSPLHLLSDVEINVFSVKNKPTDIAPKRFAARIGLVLTAIILLLNFFTLTTASLYLAALLAVFAFLESFLGFCAGCWVYTYWHRIFRTYSKIAKP